jgi:hypothetical protein
MCATPVSAPPFPILNNPLTLTSGVAAPPPVAPLRPLLPHLKCTPATAEVLCTAEEDGMLPAPAPFAVAASSSRTRPLLAAVDEAGCLTLLAATGVALRRCARWPVHPNAVFDVAWCEGDTEVVTASADCTVRVTDVASRATTAVLSGHTATVKAVRTCPGHPGGVALACA